GAEVLPVRVSDRSATAFGPGEQVTSRHVASGIRYAAEQGADVIAVTLASSHSIARVRDAVEYARKRDAVVVAAVGGADDEGAGASYPAGYPGVRSEEHTSELQSRENLVCRLLPEKNTG